MAGKSRSRGGSSSRSSTHDEPESTEFEETPEGEQSTAEEASDQGNEANIEYAEDGRMIINPKGLWFKSSKVVRECTRSTKSNMSAGYTSWSMVPEGQKEQWFNIFRQSFYWMPTLEPIVRERYNEVCQRRFRDNMYKIAVRKKTPEYMKGGAYEGLMKHRETPEFKTKSKQAKINKRGGVESSEVEPTHFGGSQSSYERALSAAKSKGSIPSAAEIFLDTHTKEGKDGERVFLKKKDKAVFDAYLHGVENNPQQKSENEIWFDVVKGYKKGAVYGVGNAQELFYDAPNRRQSSMSKQSYVPGIVSQLQDKLTAHERREAERDEEMRRLKEEMARMQSYFASCNPGYRPPPPDPRDPFNGGGSGASFGFQV